MLIFKYKYTISKQNESQSHVLKIFIENLVKYMMRTNQGITPKLSPTFLKFKKRLHCRSEEHFQIDLLILSLLKVKKLLLITNHKICDCI